MGTIFNLLIRKRSGLEAIPFFSSLINVLMSVKSNIIDSVIGSSDLRLSLGEILELRGFPTEVQTMKSLSQILKSKGLKIVHPSTVVSEYK